MWNEKINDESEQMRGLRRENEPDNEEMRELVTMRTAARK
jgi:hypothetical protein